MEIGYTPNAIVETRTEMTECVQLSKRDGSFQTTKAGYNISDTSLRKASFAWEVKIREKDEVGIRNMAENFVGDSECVQISKHERS